METKRLIYVYEDIENRVFYVGLTKDVKKRHREHNQKHHGKFDSLKTYFDAINKPIPQPKILEENLGEEEEAQQQENYWLKHYIEEGWTPINKAKTGIGKSSLGLCKCRSEDEWFEICLKKSKPYKKRSHFFRGEPGAYYVALKYKWLDLLFEPSNRKEKNYWTEEKVKEALEKCKTKTELFNKYPRAHDIAKKSGLLDEYYTNVKVEKKEHYSTKRNLIDKAIELKEQGLSIRKISLQVGIPKTTLARILKQLDL